MKICIIGCGGIGSNVAMHLIRSDIKELRVIDYDKIEKSNLNRQFFFKDQISKPKSLTLKENLERIYDDVLIEAIDIKVTKDNIDELIKGFDIVVEAVDDKKYKSLIFNKCYKKKLLVMANGIGNLELDEVKIKKVKSNIKIVGDFKSDISFNKTHSTKVLYVATVMANIIIKEIQNEK